MYTSIEIDFDVFKELTTRRQTPDMSENDVLREVFEFEPDTKKDSIRNSLQHSKGDPWVSKGVAFPNGTEFRAEYGGITYYATVTNGALEYEGKRYKSPSPAAIAITGNSVNGWIFWECKMPGSNKWIVIKLLRKKLL